MGFFFKASLLGLLFFLGLWSFMKGAPSHDSPAMLFPMLGALFCGICVLASVKVELEHWIRRR